MKLFSYLKEKKYYHLFEEWNLKWTCLICLKIFFSLSIVLRWRKKHRIWSSILKQHFLVQLTNVLETMANNQLVPN